MIILLELTAERVGNENEGFNDKTSGSSQFFNVDD